MHNVAKCFRKANNEIQVQAEMIRIQRIWEATVKKYNTVNNTVFYTVHWCLSHHV